ncbi:MAG: capsule assembly Wzi family protein [Balneolaceae bacterium]
MLRNHPVFLFFLFTPLLFPWRLDAQSIPVGDLREEQIRIQQLMNDSLRVSSFTNRPVWSHIYDAYMNPVSGQSGWWNRKLEIAEEEIGNPDLGYSIRAGFYEPVFRSTFNSQLPYGENNAAAWYGRGTTSEMAGGIYLTSDYITITLRPQFVYQQNREFEDPRFLMRDSEGNIRYLPEGMGARVDLPYRFGPEPFWTTDAGQSSIRLHYKQIEAGVSSEPLWWGGAVRYPLMLSNNAAGVPHFFLGTREPVAVPYIGSFEFRFIGGWPQDSKWYDGPDDFRQPRFLNAVNVSFSPDLIPFLTLGFTRAFMEHVPNGVSFSDFTNVFTAKNTTSTPENTSSLDQSVTVYARWLFPKAHAEIYGEFFREDRNYDFRDFLMQPHHNSGWSIGFQKLFFTSWPEFIKVNTEVTSLGTNRLDEIRWQTYFYTHSRVRQGQTNRGEVLGAAIGPGSNSVYLAVDGYKDDFKVGVFIQRLVENDHFHYRWNLENDDRPWGQGDKWNHRVNLNIGSNFLWGPGPFYVQGKLVWSKAYNYGRFDYGETAGWDWDNLEFHDVTNIQIQLGVRYVF